MKEAKEGKREVRIREWLNVIGIYLGVIISLITLIIGVSSDTRTREKEKEEARKEEMDSHPQFASWRGEKVPVGRQNYYAIYLENNNAKIDIISGTFGFEYIVILNVEENVQRVFFWKDMIAQPQMVYDKRFKGCILLIREDYYDCVKQIREICGKAGLEISECGSYIFFIFQYVNAGQNQEVYYLLKLTDERSSGAIEITEPEEYGEGFQMSL